MQFTATYSLEDNKLRLYASERLAPELYARVKSAGFIWAPKQNLFVAPMWTPSREALLIELAETIDNEDSTLEERAAERAERFENYSSKRAGDAKRAADRADSLAGVVPFGQPILIGHHSQRKAEKLRDKIQSATRQAVNFYDQSEYWSNRSAGVLSNAASKSNPRTRINRIKGLESDKRKQEKNVKECEEKISFLTVKWDAKIKRKSGVELTDFERHELILGYMRGGLRLTDAEYEQYKITKYDWLTEYTTALRAGYPAEQLRERAGIACNNTIEHCTVWVKHYEMRIKYERAMLEASGHAMPDFKAIGLERRAKTTSAPIVNTPQLNGATRQCGSDREVVEVFTITKSQFKKMSSGHIARGDGFRYRSAMGCFLTEFGLQYKNKNDHWKSYALFISDQKRVEVPTIATKAAV